MINIMEIEKQHNIHELISNFENSVRSKNEKIISINFDEISLINEIMKYYDISIVNFETVLNKIVKICNDIDISKQMKYFNNNKEKTILISLLYIIKSMRIPDEVERVELLLNSANLTIEIKKKKKSNVKPKIRTKRDLSTIGKEFMNIEIDLEIIEKYLENK